MSLETLLLLAPLAAAAATTAQTTPAAIRLPWREAGLEARQAAAHLLDRFAHGARPGEVDRVAASGPDAWFAAQLAGLPDAALERDLRRFDALAMSNREIFEAFPPPGLVLAEARRAAAIDAGDVDRRGPDVRGRGEPRRFARDRGYRSQRELIVQLAEQRLWRAVGSENQLREVLVDFWTNYFNVSLQDRQARSFLVGYERDAVRPRVLGWFRELLEATAKHPAMLLYLDNAQSSAAEGQPTTVRQSALASRFRRQRFGNGDDAERRPRGLNENYARELLELHTLGVDGGYGQQDVVEVARAFTGWSVVPPRLAAQGLFSGAAGRRSGLATRLTGVEVEGDFLFRGAAHDAGAKVVLGHRLAAGRGLEDGEQVLDILASHPSTARRVARALAVRFVADEPPAALVERLAAVFSASRGDLERTLIALAQSPEFWAEAKAKSKIKSPFELVASALRALGAKLVEGGGAEGGLAWLHRLGHLPYGYQAPTGYPDRADYWVNGGALVERMNFALAVAAGDVPNARVDLVALAGGGGLPSPEDALRVYAPRLLPERELGDTLGELEAMARDPELTRRLSASSAAARSGDSGAGELEGFFGRSRRATGEPRRRSAPTPVEQVVGVILGSPEFQRR